MIYHMPILFLLSKFTLSAVLDTTLRHVMRRHALHVSQTFKLLPEMISAKENDENGISYAYSFTFFPNLHLAPCSTQRCVT